MNLGLLLRIGAILFLTLLLVVPLAMIGGLTRERQARRDTVVQDIARSAAYAQTLTGPLLIVPYTRKVQEEQLDESHRAYTVTREVSGELRLLPATLDLAGRLDTEERRRGIYRARVFNADTTLTGRFEIPAHFGVADAASYRFGQPRLVLGISDIRGVGNALSLQANGTRVAFVPGTGTTLLPAGVQAPVVLADAAGAQGLEFGIGLQLTGTGEFQVTPVGRDTDVKLSSNWPHPGFTGEFLPRTRAIGAAGFTADWHTSFFATNLEEALSRCEPQDSGKQPACADFLARHFGVSFVDPVDQYLQSTRAVKYGFLFIALTFAGFFLFEVLRQFSVHPVQYALVGFALAMFFLLLLSLSEHIGFARAYGVSAASCVALIGYYVAQILRSRASGAGFGAALAVLYALLYGILVSEDYALLMGSLLLFALLAMAMVLTRGVNWFGLGRAEPRT